MSTMNISLPEELKTFVDQQVSGGGYTSTREYVRELLRRERDREKLRGLLLEGLNSPLSDVVDGLRALMVRYRAVESWLHNQVGPAYDALKADPFRAVAADQVRARLAAEHTKAR